MPLRTVVIVVTLSLIVLSAVASISGNAQEPQAQPQRVAVVESKPWFTQRGLNLTYYLAGSYPYLTGSIHYSGTSRISVVGAYPNGSLKVLFTSSVASPLAPNGSVADDPFFPAYLPVLPQYMVVAQSFSVLAPGYALFFTYRGSTNVDVAGQSVAAYVYSVTASQGVGAASPVTKYYYVSKTNGLILYENLSNPYTDSTFSMTLTAYSIPKNQSAGQVKFYAPVYAQPGATLNYTTTGQPPETIVYTTLYSEPLGQFMFERVNYVGGKAQNPAFFLDNYTQTLFYPAVQGFGQHVKLGVALSFDATLTYVAETKVNTPAGTFQAYAYKNMSIGFEAYFDSQTGVAVLLETPPPGGFIELAASNILKPAPPAGTPLLLVAVGVVVVAGLAYTAFLAGKRVRRRQSAYIRSRKK